MPGKKVDWIKEGSLIGEVSDWFTCASRQGDG